MAQFLRVLMTAVLLLPVLASDTHAQVLLEIDGVELHGRAWRVMPSTGTCNVLETDTSYETRKDNHGAPMDVWRLDFSVRNGSGRWLDHLIARYEVESEWPDCTNWSGPDNAQFLELNSDVPLHELTVGWSGTIGSIQESGRNVVQPGQTLTTTEFIIVLGGDPEPRFSNWSMDFDFAVNPPSAGTPASAPVEPAGERQSAPTATAEQETVFWQSIVDSENPADFEAYMARFPNGVFRSLAKIRLVALLAPAHTRPVAAEVVDFGDDSGQYARDGECDDPRFTGPGASMGLDTHLRRDATDCREQHAAGRVDFTESRVATDAGLFIDFGDDSGQYARDGECDDPRFTGPGASMGLDTHLRRDATDCREQHAAGRVDFTESRVATDAGLFIDFGDDWEYEPGQRLGNGRCEDPRFDSNVHTAVPGLDATECRRLYEAGEIGLYGIDPDSGRVTDFGDDSGLWPRDGECNDGRFWVPPRQQGLWGTAGEDATDCRRLYEAGRVRVWGIDSMGGR